MPLASQGAERTLYDGGTSRVETDRRANGAITAVSQRRTRTSRDRVTEGAIGCTTHD